MSPQRRRLGKILGFVVSACLHLGVLALFLLGGRDQGSGTGAAGGGSVVPVSVEMFQTAAQPVRVAAAEPSPRETEAEPEPEPEPEPESAPESAPEPEPEPVPEKPAPDKPELKKPEPKKPEPKKPEPKKPEPKKPEPKKPEPKKPEPKKPEPKKPEPKKPEPKRQAQPPKRPESSSQVQTAAAAAPSHEGEQAAPAPGSEDAERTGESGGSNAALDYGAIIDWENRYLEGLRRAIAAHKFYPELARRRGHEGVVRVAFVIEEDGTISHIRVAGGSGHAGLDQAAVEALQRLGSYKPIPAEFDREEWELEVPINYSLE